jgi:hypothetical protein
LFNRPKPTAGCSASGRRRRRNKKKKKQKKKYSKIQRGILVTGMATEEGLS